MSDYIKRADAIDAVCRTRCGDKAKGCPAHSCLVIEEFDALPSADAVEVVRCKECKWYKKIVEKSKSGLCHYDLVARCLHDEDYCSHGERREP